MTAVNQNFTMFAGDTKELIISVTTPDGKTVNLTGATLKWALKAGGGAPVNALLKQSPSGGIVISDALGGVFRVTLNPVDTRNLTGSFAHIGELTDSGGNLSTILTGTMTLQAPRL